MRLRRGVGAQTPGNVLNSFAPQLIDADYDVRTIQELLGHRDVSTTTCRPKRVARRLMVYTHVLNQGRCGVRSPRCDEWRSGRGS